jgi:hypothetical protein
MYSKCLAYLLGGKTQIASIGHNHPPSLVVGALFRTLERPLWSSHECHYG